LDKTIEVKGQKKLNIYTQPLFSWLELTTKDEIGPLQWLLLHCNYFCQNAKMQNSNVKKQRCNMKHNRRHSIKLC
jgi:hypothetical protein